MSNKEVWDVIQKEERKKTESDVWKDGVRRRYTSRLLELNNSKMGFQKFTSNLSG